ncbi:MAG: RNA 2',3'-cyclic phosphodiesterase [Actinoplanes sp.]
MAVFPPPAEIRSLRHALPSSARLTRTDKWHITLVFLGEVPDDRVDQLTEILAHLPPRGPFSLRLGGGGRFGTAAWTAVDGDLAALLALRDSVKGALDPAFPSDDRPFTPHLTVSYRADAATQRALADYAGQPWPVTEFSLVRSRDGAYSPVASWPA